MSNRRRRVVPTIIVIVLLTAWCWNETHRLLRAMESERTTPTLERWLPIAAELGQDDALYDRHRDYLYPPFFLVLMRPLTHLSPVAAAALWQSAKVLALVAIFGMAWNLLAVSGPLPIWIKIGSIIMSIRFIISDIRHGNINIFIAFLVVLAAWLLAKRRPWLCGLAVACATCVKVTPALWGVYLLYKRQWRASLAVLVGVVLALEVAPLIITSPAMNHVLLKRWYALVIRDYTNKGHVYSTRMNQSMVAVSNRLLGRDDLAPGEKSVSVMNLPPSTIIWVQRGMAVVLLTMLAWVCRGRLPQTNHIALAVEWSLVATITLALSGLTWTGHFCLLILAHAAVLTCLARGSPSRIDHWVTCLTIVAFLLMSLTGDLLTPMGRKWASSVGLVFFGLLVLAATLSLIRHRLRTAG